jgi:hypothetical protein
MVSQIGLNGYCNNDGYNNYLLNSDENSANNTQIGNALNFMGGKELTKDTVELSSNTVDAGELKDCLLARDKSLEQTENGNYYKKTNTGKTLGTILGFLSPLMATVVKGITKGFSKDLFNIKSLAIACPALAVAGLGAGLLIDNCINTKRAQNADEQKEVA